MSEKSLLRKLRLRQGQGCGPQAFPSRPPLSGLEYAEAEQDRHRNSFAERLAEIGAESHPHAEWSAMVESAIAAATVLYPEVPGDNLTTDGIVSPPANFTDGMAGVWPKE